MKRQLAFISFISLFAVFVFSSTLIVGGCGDGGGGGGWIVGGGGPAPLATGTFIKTPDLTDETNDFLPFPDNTTRLQVLYPASEINGSGYIEELRLFHGLGTVTDTTCPNMTVKLGHTNVSSLSSTFSANYEQGQGSLDTVVNDVNFVIPAGAAGDEISIPLETAFYYNGKDNLIVEFIQNTACSQTVRTDEDTGLADTRRVWDWPLDGTPDMAVGSQNYANLIKFVFAGGDNAIIPTAGVPGSNWFPFNTNPAWGRKVQLLYSAGAIDGSGPITGIGMIVNVSTTEQEYTMTVRLGHSTLTDLTTIYDNNFSDTPVTVASGVVFKVPAGIPAGETVWFPLPDGTFTYNGLNNLIVEIDVIDNSSATGETFWRENFPVVNNVRLFGDTGAATGNVDQGGYHIKFRFNGGTMDVITDGGAVYIIPVGNPSEYIYQILYDSTALGTGGQITSMGFRLGWDANAFDHTDVNLVLGHTTLSTLGIASLAANIESDWTAAFSGTISIPAGLKAGDWVKIPLTTPFTYDPTMNLVVQWDAPAFATFNPSIGHTFSTGRYAGHGEGNIGDRTSDVSNAPTDFVLDMSLTVNK